MGVSREQASAQAEALVIAFSKVMDSQLATKTDINPWERELIHYQMVGLVRGGIVTLILMEFFQSKPSAE